MTKGQVKAWQKLIGVAVDGDFGDLTKEGTIAFAEHQGLIPAAVLPPPIISAPSTVSPAILATLQDNNWPQEEDAAAFFGYPPNLTQVAMPFPLDTDDGEVMHFACSMKVAASLRRIFTAIGMHYSGNLEAMRKDGANYFDGCYADRSIRGSSRRSMHAYGAAIDLDAAHNELGATTGRMPLAVRQIFKAEGWRWGGDYKGRKDWMHFEACK